MTYFFDKLLIFFWLTPVGIMYTITGILSSYYVIFETHCLIYKKSHSFVYIFAVNYLFFQVNHARYAIKS